jgi:uncharacterized membrane protein YccC
MLALYLSLYFDLDKPQWAMMTAYLVSQPFSGAVRSKAFFRILGTLLGAVATVLIVPLLSNAPVFLSLVLAVWVGGCLYFSLLDRTPRSYVFLLAGITATFIAFPSVNAPLSVFDMAVSRVEEIAIGVLCSAFFHTVFFPQSMRTTIASQFQETFFHLKKWTSDTLRQENNSTLDLEQHRLAADITALHMMATHVPFDTHEPRRVSTILAAVQDQLIVMFPIITSLSDRLMRVNQGKQFPEEISDLTGLVRSWLDLPRQQMMEEKSDILERCRQLQPLGANPSWYALLRLNMAVRLTEFVETVSVYVELFHSFDKDNKAPMSAAASTAFEERNAHPLHKDQGLALRISLTTIGVLFIGCLLWIVTGWPEGDSALMMSSVMCCLFANQPNPVPAQRMFLLNATLATIVGGIYLFAVIPMVHTFPTLVLIFSPVLLLAGTLMALPGWEGKMLAFLVTFCGTFSLAQHFEPDFASFANRNAAQLIGIASVVFATRLLYTFSSHKSIQRMLTAVWRDLADLASARNPMTGSQWTHTMLDRIGLLMPYVDILQTDDRLKSVELMRDLRTGLNIIHLQQSGPEVSLAFGRGLENILILIADYFENLARSGYSEPSEELLKEIDIKIGNIINSPQGQAREAVLNSLTGLRCNLFPLSMGYGTSRSAL